MHAMDAATFRIEGIGFVLVLADLADLGLLGWQYDGGIITMTTTINSSKPTAAYGYMS